MRQRCDNLSFTKTIVHRKNYAWPFFLALGTPPGTSKDERPQNIALRMSRMSQRDTCAQSETCKGRILAVVPAVLSRPWCDRSTANRVGNNER